MHDHKKGYRKIVASPEPKKIVELNAIRELVENGHIVIACGGGGIPVSRNGKTWHCADAVIDKDLTTQVLGNALSTREMVILTNESYAYTQYNTKPTPIHMLSLAKARYYLNQGEFGAGSMEPKIRSTIRFIQKGGKTAYIGKTGELNEVLNHEKGTRIHA